MGSFEFAFFQEKNHSTVEKENPFIKILPTYNKGDRKQFESALQNLLRKVWKISAKDPQGRF